MRTRARDTFGQTGGGLSKSRKQRAAKLAEHIASGTYVPKAIRSHFTRPDIERAFVKASRGTAVLSPMATALVAFDPKKHRSAATCSLAPRRPFRPGRSVRSGVTSHERALRTLGYVINGRLLARQKRTPQLAG